MRKIFFFVLMSIALIVSVAACGPTVNYPATATSVAATQQAPTAEATIAPTTEPTKAATPQSVPPEKLLGANEVVNGKEVMPVYDFGILWSCPGFDCPVGAFKIGDEGFTVFQADDVYQSRFITYTSTLIKTDKILVAELNPAGDFVYASNQDAWTRDLTTPDPLLNGVAILIEGEKLRIIDSKTSSFDPVGEVVWTPYHPDAGSDETCITEQFFINPSYVYGGNDCAMAEGKWVDQPLPYPTYNYGGQSVEPVMIEIPFTYNRTTRTWDPIKKQ